MADETIEQINETSEVDSNIDYIAAINELKQNSVNRSDYEKLRADNKKLLNAIVNGQGMPEVKTESKRSLEEIRNDLFHKDSLSNLQYCKTALELRNTLIENGEKDPFLPWGEKITPTDEDIACANRVASVMQECIDYADGDSNIFTNELMRRTIDTAPTKRRNK